MAIRKARIPLEDVINLRLHLRPSKLNDHHGRTAVGFGATGRCEVLLTEDLQGGSWYRVSDSIQTSE